MKPLQLTLSLAAALAAMPAMAQDNAPPIQIKFEVADQDPDFCLALVSLENGTVPFMGERILDNAIVLVLAKQGGSFVYDAYLLMQCDADLWWQGVTYDMVDGLKIHAIQKVAADRADNPDESFDATAGADNGYEGAGSEPEPVKNGAPAIEPPPIELSFLPAEDGSPGSVLQAKLIGPTSDYGLVLVNVRVDAADADAGGGKADVFLYRKLPGEGEGMLDIVEEHTVTADLTGARTIRVFLATGTQSKPGVATAWTLLKTLVQ